MADPSTGAQPKKRGFGVISTLILIVAGVFVSIAIFGPSQPDKPPAEKAKLDYSKQVFTTSGTIACPTSLMFAVDADHSPQKVAEMFTSIDRSAKAKALGCTELQDGVPVYASVLKDGFTYIGVSKDRSAAFFTREADLTNAVPGQSASDAAELAVAHINIMPSEPVPTSGGDPKSPVRVLLSIPFEKPIPTGAVTVAPDPTGTGAYICPDENTFAAFMDAAAVKASADGNEMATMDWNILKRYGCSYLPPRTPMVSTGPGNTIGSLVLVSVSLPDGRKLKGVTFPNSVIAVQPLDSTQAQVPSPVPVDSQSVLTAEQQQTLDQLLKQEDDRHEEAIRQEEQLNRVTVEAIKAEENSLDVTKMSGHEPTEAGQRIVAKFSAEIERHKAAVEQEQQRHLDEQAKAKKLATSTQTDATTTQ